MALKSDTEMGRELSQVETTAAEQTHRLLSDSLPQQPSKLYPSRVSVPQSLWVPTAGDELSAQVSHLCTLSFPVLLVDHHTAEAAAPQFVS